MKVRIMVFGGGEHEVEVPADSSMQDAADKAGVSLNKLSLKFGNDHVVYPDTILKDDGSVILVTGVPNVVGGRS